MGLLNFLVASLAVGTAEAGLLRFACSQVVTERLDPIVNKGSVPSPHMHQIVGGNAFNAVMDGDIPGQATCTTCTFSENFSNYWTAVMYFQARNGSFKRVPQIANQYLNGANGGMTVYYESPTDKSVNVTAFRPGFRMLVGNANARKPGMQTFVNSYRCYTGKNFEPNPFGISPDDTSDFPKKHCPGGVRVATFFPTCWDGKNLDSPNHQSHVSYGGFDGSCPKSHPVQIPRVFLETVWNTGAFSPDDWPTNGTQPFVWAQGDPYGYGAHADYVFGWKGDALQKAMDARCDGPSCPQLKQQTISTANKCNLKQIVPEELDGWLPILPGNLPVTYA